VEDTTAGMQEVERIRTNIGYIRVKMSGSNFPDRVEEVRARALHMDGLKPCNTRKYEKGIVKDVAYDGRMDAE